MRRKMKTATYRSRPEDTSDTFPIDENKIKNEYEETFSPRGSKKVEESGSDRKRSRSLVCKIQHDLKLSSSPRRNRKKTHDFTGEMNEAEKRQKQL